MLVSLTENHDSFIYLFLFFFQLFSFISSRQELMREREKQKEAEVEALKCSMQSGMVSFLSLSNYGLFVEI